jgi:hypothetical protein
MKMISEHLVNRKSPAVPSNNLIILFTPVHTGTHFVRMLLESHPAIGASIGEDYRIDRKFRPNHILSGSGTGSKDDHKRQDEPMLLEFFRNMLKGNGTEQAFLEALEYWQTISSEEIRPRKNYDYHLHEVVCRFRRLGITLAAKREQFLLYRGHCHREYLAYDFSTLAKRSRLVTTIRNPLLSILTILRRQEPSRWKGDVDDYLAALQCIFSLENAFIFCTDLWQQMPEKMETLFLFLGLQIAPNTETYLAIRPVINKTREKSDRYGDMNCCLKHENPTQFHAMLSEAKQQLADNKLHTFLVPYWNQIRSSGLIPHFEKHGYQFDF